MHLKYIKLHSLFIIHDYYSSIVLKKILGKNYIMSNLKFKYRN